LLGGFNVVKESVMKEETLKLDINLLGWVVASWPDLFVEKGFVVVESCWIHCLANV